EAKADPPADTPVPGRRPDSFFYLQDFLGEQLAGANFIREDLDAGPGVDEESTLDTLYSIYAPSTDLNFRPLMTFYHGPTSARFIFSGFPLWYFKQSEARQLAEFVLHDLWGYEKKPSVPAPARVRAARSSIPPRTPHATPLSR